MKRLKREILSPLFNALDDAGILHTPKMFYFLELFQRRANTLVETGIILGMGSARCQGEKGHNVLILTKEMGRKPPFRLK
jgi:hypothetical protein